MNIRFDLRTLDIFVTVVERENIAHAAERHHIAASAVSKRITDMEEALGVSLLVRRARGVVPTAAGQAMMAHAKSILQGVERLQSELADYAGGARGHVRLLVNKSAIVQFLPEDLRSFADAYPDIAIDLEEDNSPGILQGVIEDRAELGVYTAGAGSAADLTTFPYRSDRLVVLARDDHPLANAASARFGEVLRHDLIGLHAISAWNSLMTAGADAADGVLNVRYRVTSFDAVQRMVGAGLGIALVPSGVLADAPGTRLRGIALDEDWAQRELRIATRSLEVLAPAARRLLEHLLASGASKQASSSTMAAVASRCL